MFFLPNQNSIKLFTIFGTSFITPFKEAIEGQEDCLEFFKQFSQFLENNFFSVPALTKELKVRMKAKRDEKYKRNFEKLEEGNLKEEKEEKEEEEREEIIEEVKKPKFRFQNLIWVWSPPKKFKNPLKDDLPRLNKPKKQKIHQVNFKSLEKFCLIFVELWYEKAVLDLNSGISSLECCYSFVKRNGLSLPNTTFNGNVINKDLNNNKINNKSTFIFINIFKTFLDMTTKNDQQQPSTSTQTSPTHNYNNSITRVHKRILSQATAAICQMADLTQICCSSRELCEHTGRIDVQKFPEFLQSIQQTKPPQFTVLPQSPVKSPPLLRISDPRPHPPYFPNFLPPFPDPHTYIWTEIKDDIDNTYEKVRCLTAANKRDDEKSLINYALCVYPSICVFQELSMRLKFESKNMENGNGGDNEYIKRKKKGEEKSEEIKQENNDEEQTFPFVNKKVETITTTSASTLNELIINEEQLRLHDTELSYVFKRIPPHCHILLPFEDKHPYITALVTDDVTDSEEHNYFASILSKEMEEEEEEEFLENNNDEEEQMDTTN
ncbi:BTP domain-containing protein [Meloidogyne graminicola]|uniref:Transcription initiation factor TFIID subunit 8 n=1 Tax=Meloidogyne graminicola TaxID=189291 RepID=A0A8T0A336_9BILA|nr:BTP domain-containing protein [Meloidogyne graminicola]